MMLSTFLPMWNRNILRFMQKASSYLLEYGLDDPRFESRQGQDVSVSSNTSRLPLEPTQSPIQYLPGLFPTDHSPPSNANIETGWSKYPRPRTLLMACVGNTVPASTFYRYPVHANFWFRHEFHTWYFNTGNYKRTE